MVGRMTKQHSGRGVEAVQSGTGGSDLIRHSSACCLMGGGRLSSPSELTSIDPCCLMGGGRLSSQSELTSIVPCCLMGGGRLSSQSELTSVDPL